MSVTNLSKLSDNPEAETVTRPQQNPPLCSSPLQNTDGPQEVRVTSDVHPSTSKCAQQKIQNPPRKSQRSRTLTEKGRGMLNQRIKELEQSFKIKYEKWKVLAKDANHSISDNCSDEELQAIINNINTASSELNTAYENWRQVDIPDNNARRRIDTCEEVTRTVIKTAQRRLRGKAPVKPQFNVDESFLMSEKSYGVSKHSQVSSQYKQSHVASRVASKSSSASSMSRQEAAAKMAAAQATLEILHEQQCQQAELLQLEAEDKRQIAEQTAEACRRRLRMEEEEAQLQAKLEVENAARRKLLEDKRKELERLEALKQLRVAKATMQVYEQEQDEDSEEEIKQLLHGCKTESQREGDRFQHTSHIHNSPELHLPQQAIIHPQHDGGIAALAMLLADSISASRLPMPEPTTFSGDPLKYKNWKAAFQTLIERKNIPASEKIYYLCKYVSGPAKKAVENYFLLGTEAAYKAAWEVLDERFGNSFLIAKAFRDKLSAWPRIGSKDSLELQEFVDFLRSCEAAESQIKGLEVLNDCNENQKILSKLPDWLTSRWNRKVLTIEEETGRFPSFSQFVQFLIREARIACNPVTSLHALKQCDGEKVKPQRNQTPAAKVLTTNTDEKIAASSCLFCERPGHSLYKCRKFLERPILERHRFVQDNKLCFGCLKPGHHSRDCKYRSTCSTCQKRHPTCLHDDQREQKTRKTEGIRQEARHREQSNEQLEEREAIAISEATSNRVQHDNTNIQTSTIIPVWVSMMKEPDRETLVYALLDTQSDTTFILEEAADSLNAKGEQVKLKLSTMASTNKVVACQRISGLQVRGFNSEKKITLPTTYTRKFIPANRDHIPTPETAMAWPHLEQIADRIAPRQGCDVGLLIGYNCSQALLPREVVCGEENQPFAQRTDLGWSIIGHGSPYVDCGDTIGVSHQVITRQVTPELQLPSSPKQEVHYVCRTQIKEVISSDIIKALECDFNERVAEDNHFSQDDLQFLSKLKQGIKHKEDGHIEMPLPFKRERPSLPDNMVCAIHRLKHLERKLRRNSRYYQDYKTFMEETIARGDAEKIPKADLHKHPVWYIPHHGVYHPQKPGKIRIVFDCSARFQGTSLNDHLLTGPELTNSLVGVLCRFRKEKVAIMCDIERMFHQFHVRAEDQDYLRFLWWENGDLEAQPAVYRMRVHLFGAASSPGCANYGLKHLAAMARGNFSEASVRFIERNFYVDDGLTSVSTEAKGIQLVNEARELCNTGNLRLHKFISNSKQVLSSIPKEECAGGANNLDMALHEPHMERALGVQWCVTSDDFQFRVVVKEKPMSRRGVLSTVASVFDPLGFVAPFILLGKKILQQMCLERVSWDDPLPDHLLPQWESWLRGLQDLATIKVQRCYLPGSFGKVVKYELHHFSDASASGYGECSYLRVISASGEVHCSLVMGKARVAPSKVTTIPRLELSAAVVAVRTSDMLQRELEMEGLQEYFWTDSRVVLGYINNDARRFHVFVANRVQRIKQSTHPDQWNYIASEDNPADHSSRGQTAEQLKASNWFRGPNFLWQLNLPSSVFTVGEISEDDPELRKTHVHKIHSREERSLLDRLERFSDWARAVQAVAILKRRARAAKGHKPRFSEPTTLQERKEAEVFLIKLVQATHLAETMKSLKLNGQIKAIDKANKLHKLNPFLDEQGVLRVGGRLTMSSLHPHVKHPAILPKGSHLATLLIKHHHEKVQHQGRGMTVNELRANGVWILGCSKAVSSHIYNCTKCRKFRRNTEGQRMANLPQERTELSPPFTYCGMDCFGPIYVKDGRKELKRYGLLLTCMCSRAIHIEMLEDLTTDAFINALRSFIALRGSVRQIRCDQGSNFIGARHEFAEAMKEMDGENLKKIGCEFVMNTPSASHKGGVWERQIRTVRNVLASVLDQAVKRLDSSSLRTFLYEVMAIVNSRPLTSEHLHNPSGPEPLTPNHILTMKSSIIPPPPGKFIKEDVYLQKRWRRVQFLANSFWERWKREYLLNLQSRQKWNRARRNAKVNDIVLLKDDSAPRSQWKMGRIIDVYLGQDGKVRSVRLLISDSTLDARGRRTTKPTYLERPIQKTVTLLEAN